MTKKQVTAEPDTEPPASPTQKQTPVKSPLKSKTSSSSSFFLVPLLVLVAAAGWGKYAQREFHADSVEELLSKVSERVSAQFSELSGAAPVEKELLWKYDDERLISMEVRHLVSDLSCKDDKYSATTLFEGKTFPVQNAMQLEQSMGNDRVFFMLNGRNEGVYVSWNGAFNCVGKAAELAAGWLGADRDVMENGVRLYNQMGFAIHNAEDLAQTNNIVHILLDFQLWQWPGIEKGYQYVLEDGVVLTTVALSPKVFDVQYFLTQNESEKIMELGKPMLNRSKVDGSNSSKVVSKSRTSHTAFLEDDLFTRDFRVRAARVARLPSPTFAERLQLLQYNAGEFYRQHFDTFHSREFLPPDADLYVLEDYKEWAKWAAEKLRSLDQSKVPEEFREGNPLFPDAEDQQTFPNALLEVFYQQMSSTNMFKALFDTKYEEWIRTNLDKNAVDLIPDLMYGTRRPSYLPRIVRAWEEKLGLGELRYTFPKPQVNGQSHFYNWVRWAKERVSYLGDGCPPVARSNGDLYPQYTVEFQERLMKYVQDDYSADFITRMTNPEWFEWLQVNRGRNLVLFQVLKTFPHFAELVIRTWESRVGSPLLRYKLPKYVKHFHPQRYVTLFMYLNNQTKIGGETVFPFAVDRFSDEEIVRDGMNECSTGLAVPPRGLHASLFYTQTPEGDIDHMSRHGGCPPHEGTKWGSNAFMWDSDADEGAELWTTK
ncbi:hypothetical protein PHYBOEH_011630 [Phytophthora boehmeriae]|uniref:Prolyl 4-hydroxylase alpha subunit domain-containing protein n=1 Tax=Phytophthora boehmeriae TaxID=109152 RepID=A0A8T1X782_9STRA|nr:hypothetical protein PHYBOEH_011630 [Phytophthora boehmeriae]